MDPPAADPGVLRALPAAGRADGAQPEAAPAPALPLRGGSCRAAALGAAAVRRVPGQGGPGRAPQVGHRVVSAGGGSVLRVVNGKLATLEEVIEGDRILDLA